MASKYGRPKPPKQRYQTNHCYDNIANQTNLKSISSIDSNRYASKLGNDGKLLRPKHDYNQSFRRIFENYGASVCCCVLPNTRIIPFYNFESTHFIYFQYKTHSLKSRRNHHHKSSFHANNYQTQKRYAYYLLHITYRQLSAIDKFIKQNNGNHRFFADTYPKPLAKTQKKRGILQSIYEYEEKLLMKPVLPSGPSKVIFGKKKSMTYQHLQQYAAYLHAIFASPSLLLEDELYSILEIEDPEIRTLFKILALTKLNSLKSEAMKYDHIKCLRDPTRLKKKIGINFHTLWIVKRPLNDKNAAFLGCDHWALKFEGNDQLMTIDFFAYNKDHGIILTKIVPSTPLNRRLFWYYWPRDNTSSIEWHHFNVPWTVLEKIYLKEMSCELVGILISEWLSYDNHAVYELTHNNCQHFVRDFVAGLDLKIAKRLSSSFDVKVIKSLIPAGVLAEGIDAEAKCNNIHNRLFPILKDYTDKAQQRKQEEEKIDEQEQLQKNWDEIANKLGISLSSSSSENEEEDMVINEKKEEEEENNIDHNKERNGNECYDDKDEENELKDMKNKIDEHEDEEDIIINKKNDSLNMELIQELSDIVDNEWDSWHSKPSFDGSPRKHPTRSDTERNHKNSQTSNNKNNKNQKPNRNNQNGSGFNGNNGNGGNDGNDRNDGRRNNDDNDDKDDKKRNNDKINDENKDEDEDENETKDEDEEEEKKKMEEKQSMQTLNRNAIEFIPDFSNGLVSIKSPLLTINEKQLFPPKTNANNKGKTSFPNKCIAPRRAKGIIQISHKMAKTIVPENIMEKISNVYSFIDGSVKLQYHYHQFVSSGDNVFVFNLDFHAKITKETLYAVVEKQNGTKNRHYEYKMHNKLFTKKEIISIFYQNQMGISYLPQSSRLNNNKFVDEMNYIHIIRDILKSETRESIISRANWHKIPIFNNIKNNKQRMTLSLNKEVFIDKYINFMNNDTNNKQPLMHILVFDDMNHRIVTIEYLQIVEVDKNTDIGISYRYDSKINMIIPSRIYLQKQDILDVHELVLPQHECHCLDNYRMSNITHLNIGNADSQLNRVKDLQKRNKELKTKNKYLEKENKKLNSEIGKLQQLVTRLTNENKSISSETLSNTTCSVPLSQSVFTPSNINIIQQSSQTIQPMIMGPISSNTLQPIQININNMNIQQASSVPAYIWMPIIPTYPIVPSTNGYTSYK